jgi:hypothetical protein
MLIDTIRTTGDARKIIMETIIALKDETMDINRGMAIAANMKVLNDSICAEINAAKLSIQAQAIGKDFGQLVMLGKRPIFDDQPLIEE